MKSVSWDDAFLILKKWRDEKSAVFFKKVSSWQVQADTTMAGGSAGHVLEADSDSGIVELSLDETPTPLDFTGATFRYADERDNPFPDEAASPHPCVLEITFPDGELWVFDEWPEPPEL